MLAIECESRAPGVLVDEQHAIPFYAAVFRAIHAALLLRPRRAAECADVHEIRIRRMHDDLADASHFFEADVLPRRAGVGRFVDAVAHHVRVADRPRFAGTGPHDARVGWRNGQCADRLHALIIEDRPEGARAVGGLPDAARRRAEVVRRRVARDTRHGSDAPAVLGAHVLKARRLHRRGTGARRTAAALGMQRVRREANGGEYNSKRSTNHGRNAHRQELRAVGGRQTSPQAASFPASVAGGFAGDRAAAQ